jgi:hypothetical protein
MYFLMLQRIYKSVFFVRRKRYSIKGALCLNGLLAYAIQEGPMNSNDYSDFVENILVIIFIILYVVYFNNYMTINMIFFYSSFLR